MVEEEAALKMERWKREERHPRMAAPRPNRRGAWSGWRKAELMIFTWGRMDGEMMRRVHGDQ